MTRDETRDLLRLRYGLTKGRRNGQEFNEPDVDAWHQAFIGRGFDECSDALTKAAKLGDRVAPADVAAQLPRLWTSFAESTRGCGCSSDLLGDEGQLLLCPHEQAAGLAGIARAREALQRARADR